MSQEAKEMHIWCPDCKGPHVLPDKHDGTYNIMCPLCGRLFSYRIKNGELTPPGKTLFVDEVNGNDSNIGILPELAVKTHRKAAEMFSGEKKIVYFTVGPNTIITEVEDEQET